MSGLLVMLKLPLKWGFLLALTISFAFGTSPPVLIKCERLTNPNCQNAGWNYTAPFPDIGGKPFQEVKGSKELQTYIQPLSSCSKYSATILCSLYFPKCVGHLPGPVLPCQSVCNDFVHSCGSWLDKAAMRGLFSAICDLLPLYDGKADTCFIPEGFNVSKAASGLDKSTCHKVSIPTKCQDDLHYNFTFIANDTQSLSNIHLLTPIIASKCSADIEKFTCFTRMPPCSTNKTIVKIPCKSLCQKINNSCYSEFVRQHIPIHSCDFYPNGSGSNGICTLTKWPAPWVRVAPTSPPTTTVAPSPEPACRFCQKITIEECAKAGYDNTFHFKDVDGKPFLEAASKALGKFIKLLKCSPEYAQAVLCSMYLPKCDPRKCDKKPVLPCRRVCQEFVSSCAWHLRAASLHGLFVGLCDLLPLNDTAKTPCFVPPGFKPTSKAYQRQVCFPISNDTTCTKDFSYNTTFITPTDQRSSKLNFLQPIVDSKCSSYAEKFFCYTRIPPCGRKGELSVALPCRWMCKDVATKCKDVFKKYRIPVADCDFLLPDADSDEDGICRTNTFPVPLRHFNHPKPVPQNHKKRGPNAGLIAGMIVLVLIIIVAAVLGVLYYRRKKNLKPFEPRVLHNVEEKDSY